MKYKSMTAMVNIIILLMVAVLLISCAEPIRENTNEPLSGVPVTDITSYDTEPDDQTHDNDIIIDDVPPLSEEPDGQTHDNDIIIDDAPLLSEESDYILPITGTQFGSVEQLILYNQNPFLLNTGDATLNEQILNIHQSGSILSRDAIYIPTMPLDEYVLSSITQHPNNISFCYVLEKAETYEERIATRITVYIEYTEEDVMPARETQFDVVRDADGYLYAPENRYICYQVDSDCYVSVNGTEGTNDYDTMRAFCQVQSVNVHSDAVTE